MNHRQTISIYVSLCKRRFAVLAVFVFFFHFFLLSFRKNGIYLFSVGILFICFVVFFLFFSRKKKPQLYRNEQPDE